MDFFLLMWLLINEVKRESFIHYQVNSFTLITLDYIH